MLLTFAVAALFAQQVPPQSGTPGNSSLSRQSRESRVDIAAADLLARARAARGTADSTLRAYSAIVTQDAMARVRIGTGHERLGFRYESVQRVRWEKLQGVVIDIVASRAAVPLLSGFDLSDDAADVVGTMQDFASVPHYPGREALWPAEIVAKASGADERHFIHPLARGAEAYYTYHLGNSLVITLPDRRRVFSREMRVAPRRPAWNLVAGSFWFDSTTSQLVRAAYRPAVSLDISERRRARGRRDVSPALRPMRVTITAAIVDYALFEGRWWLPRLHRLEGEGRINAVRIPFLITERFEYESVDADLGALPLAAGTASPAGRRQDTPFRGCRDPRDTAVHVVQRASGGLTVTLRVPCDTLALAAAMKALAGDAPAEALLGDAEATEIRQMLKRAPRPEWSPQRPVLHWGLRDGLLRFNRVEGLSLGGMLNQELGRGWSGEMILRLGTADREPRGEMAATRIGAAHDFRIAVFHRLAVSNDWGDPLTLASSLRALLLARDEGFYFAASGAEVTSPAGSAPLAWRAFVERQAPARTSTQLSLPRLIDGDSRYDDVRDATRASAIGAAVRWRPTLGLDADRLRALGDLRLEVAAGDFGYARGAADIRLSRTYATSLAVSVGAGAGGHAGRLPTQRAWFLGGMQTVRGQPAGAAAGDAYALSFAEVGAGTAAIRPTVFVDAGRTWGGSAWGDLRRTIAGTGLGLSLIDGLVRTDLAYGLRPSAGWRFDAYIRAGF